MAELDLSTLTTEQQIAALYIGYYDRAGEPDGSTFWENTLEADNAFGLASIASNFAVQQETLDAHPFFTDPTAGEANAFITDLYINLFNRQVDEDGLAFWSDILTGVIDGESFDSNSDGNDDISEVGDIILAIIEGAQDVEGGDQDKTTILNKIEVATAWTDAAEAAGATGAWDDLDEDVQASAKSIIEDVDETETTVTEAKATINTDFAPEPVPGNDIFLTSATDVNGVPNQITGETLEATDDNDTFWGYIAQNPFAGGVSNTLSSADRLDGEGGDDRLYAELSVEFVGIDADDEIDVQPRLTSIEEIDFEAREGQLQRDGDGDTFFSGITVDAKHITDHEEIGSYYSDEDLKIENLTTLTEGGSARNTSDITVTMDHTDNFNSDNDASDLVVLFDNDYLLSGQTEEGFADFFMLDQDAEERLLDGEAAEGRLDDLDKNGIQFRIDTDGDGDVDDDDDVIEVSFDETLIVNDDINTHEEFRDALQAPLQDLIADGTLPEGTTIELFEYATVVEDDQGRNANRAVLDNGANSDLIPAVRVELGNDGEVAPVGFSTPDTEVPPFNFFGRVKSEFEETDEPISINIDLEKVGRGGDGGDLQVGGKAQNPTEGIAGGIEVFNINVKGVGGEGADAKPSSLGSITSTLSTLSVVNIATHEDFVDGDSFASLVVRDGFNGVLDKVDADDFLGNLTLGSGTSVDSGDGVINNVETVTAMGGGDITINAVINEPEAVFDYDTGSGDDDVTIELEGDATDYAGSSLNVSTGGGDDVIDLFLGLIDDVANDSDSPAEDESSEQLNQAILDNVDVDGGSGDDHINVDGLGNANIEGGSGNDVIMTDGTAAGTTTDGPIGPVPTGVGQNAIWAFNFDAERADVAGGDIGDFLEDELPGEQLSLAYIGGATVTVTLSGAGINGNAAAGGGVMSDGALGAIIGDDGYESEVTISSLLNGNDHFGTQADINAAVIEAINEDAVLGELLAARMGPNNTLVVESLTSGAFDETDLRIDIEQLDQSADGGDEDDWDAVEAEAQQIFQDSDITIESLNGSNPVNAGTYGAADLTGSAEADEWYDGLSVDDGDDSNTPDDNSTEFGVGEGVSNLHTAGTASTSETDNVIDGGAGDDLIVLSTDADGGIPIPFSVSSNNALINGASNETIKLTGETFGDDTVMNFEDGAAGDLDLPIYEFDIRSTSGGTAPFEIVQAATDNTTTVFIDGVTTDGSTVEVVLADGDDSDVIATKVADGINTDPNSAYSVTVTNDGTASVDDLLTLTPTSSLAGTPSFTATETEPDGTVVETFSQGDYSATGLVTNSSVTFENTDNLGLDFLDFTAYLTSEENTSTASGSDSDTLIPVTLDNTDSADVAANEVTVVDQANAFDDTDDDGETFANLSESVVEQLFNNDGGYTGFSGNNTFGNLDADDFNADDEYGDGTNTDDLISGAAKSILMIENADNDGEYKVFELSWDGDEDADDDSDLDGQVTANELGSIDFGDTLTDLDPVNIVGTEEYNTLLDDGFFA